MSGKLKDVNDLTFQQEVLEEKGIVVVDFWAPWCGPCRMVTPILEELSDEYAGRVKFVAVNTDVSPMIAMQLGIRSIPTVMFFKNGELVDSRIGAMPKREYVRVIEKLLALQ